MPFLILQTKDTFDALDYTHWTTGLCALHDELVGTTPFSQPPGCCFYKLRTYVYTGRKMGVGTETLLWEKYVCYAWFVWWQDLWARALLLSWHWTWEIGDRAGVATLLDIVSVCVCKNTHRLTIPLSQHPPATPTSLELCFILTVNTWPMQEPLSICEL